MSIEIGTKVRILSDDFVALDVNDEISDIAAGTEFEVVDFEPFEFMRWHDDEFVVTNDSLAITEGLFLREAEEDVLWERA